AARYGNARLWGSAGFIASVAGLGPVLDRYGAAMLLPVMLCLLVAMFVCAVAVPDRPRPAAAADGDGLVAVLKRPAVVALIAVGLLAQLAHGPYYSFFSLFLEDLGYTRTTIGVLWALGVVAEIGVFVFMGRLLARFPA